MSEFSESFQAYPGDRAAVVSLLRTTGVAPEDVPYVIGCGEEAVGDRYQRGGGNLAKAIAEQAGCLNASGSDVKAFCCGPVHALVVAASLVASGVYPRVVVLGGAARPGTGWTFRWTAAYAEQGYRRAGALLGNPVPTAPSPVATAA